MLSFLAASAAEFLRLLIFVFDLDLFVEIVNRNDTLKTKNYNYCFCFTLSPFRTPKKMEFFNFKKKSINRSIQSCKIID